MRKGEIVTGSLSGLSFIAALDAYVGTGTSSWLADICFSGDAPAPMIEGIPMVHHSKYAAYFTSAGLTFLAACLGWEYAEAQIAKINPGAPQGTQRKRLLACILYISTAAHRANQRVIDTSFLQVTGHKLGPTEAKEAFDFLMRKGAPDLGRMLAGASDRERKKLLRASVMTWAAHGMDSEQSTAITEHIVSVLGFDQDDICATLDRLWLKEKAKAGLRTGLRLTRIAVQKAAQTTLFATKRTAEFLAPYVRRAGARAFAVIQR